MSGDNENERRSILGEFSAAHKKEFEIPLDRDFEQTTDAQLEMDDERQYEINSLDQRLEAEKDSLAAQNPYVPTYGLTPEYSVDLVEKYTDMMNRYEKGREQVDVKYTNMRDQIRENGVTLSDEFEAQVPEPIEEHDTSQTDLQQLGIDVQYDFNSVSDHDYYGRESASDFTDYDYSYDESYGSHYEGDFSVSDNGNDNDNSGGHGR